ncbi:hypothetical protein L1D54_12665 [Vibrio brasiliensis]|uniref:DUF6884 domain-containing protein n=1 Tax=Vibrio brasiliensis TaxID=170652 RepID=UPI001EFC62F0|nr:DUF6884 domain-containing protein [Vibrio brasiliensis]MCG9751338.1 hypothetical protein [Vibrio brasiliensis]
MSEIHLLVPCSAHKTSSVPESMYMGKHRTSDLMHSLNTWVEAFEQHSERYPASDLYLGQAFQYAKKLAEDHQFKLSIMSAGFGLVSSDVKLPSYNATFANNIDRVPVPHTHWWSSVCQSTLPGASIFAYMASNPSGRFILCVSNEYLRAIQEDLLFVLENNAINNEDIVIIASSIPKKLQAFKSLFIQASRKVLFHSKSAECGLALTDRHVTSIATYLFVEQLRLTKAPFNAIIPALNKELQTLTVPTKPSRIRRDDDFIISFIEKAFIEHDGVGQGRLFKQYKDEGNACTDTRFRSLYNRIKLTKAQRD